ncbi:unnamed protein product [Auanema sp. JU1783]|nr:unnamed protein product [Auanema sp. JU1783]
MIIFGGLSLLLNLASFVPLLNQKKGKTLLDNPGHLPLFLLLLLDTGLALILSAPIYSLTTQRAIFDEATCQIYGSLDMALSLAQIVTACTIAFDRYISTISPKWGKWRCHGNYMKLISIILLSVTLWSVVPIFGYGKYDLFLDGHFCSLDWKQGDIDDSSSPLAKEQAHRYIGFLTATCLVFFLIPVCIASSFYYSVIDHVERLNSMDTREEANSSSPTSKCPWAFQNHVAKVGLGCLLSSTIPYLAYSVVCLNPMKSDFRNASYVIGPVIASRFAPLLNPILYIWLNSEVVPIDAWIAKKWAKPKPRTTAKNYQTISLMMNVPGVSFPILTPSVPRRQLPQIPPHLVSPSKRPSTSFFDEQQPMLR